MASTEPTASETKHPTDASSAQHFSTALHLRINRCLTNCLGRISTRIPISTNEPEHLHHPPPASQSHLVPLWRGTHPPYLTERHPNGPRKELNMQGYNQRFPISLRSPKKIECCVSKWANVIRYVRKAMTILPVVRHKILREEQVRLWH